MLLFVWYTQSILAEHEPEEERNKHVINILSETRGGAKRASVTGGGSGGQGLLETRERRDRHDCASASAQKGNAKGKEREG